MDAVTIFIIAWCLLILGFETAKHNPFKLPVSHWRVNRFISWAGLWHSWSMFAPQPLHSNRNVYCRAVDADGKELSVWTEPDWTVVCDGGEPPEDANWWWHVKAFWKGKWELFWHMRLRKVFSSCGEGRQWDMPLLLRQVCRMCEQHMNRNNIYPDTIAMFIDIEYSPYYCPREGIKDWKAARDMFDQLVYIYECENTTDENRTTSDDLDGEVLHLPYSVAWEWKRRTPVNGGEEAWMKTLIDADGNEWIADTSPQPEQENEPIPNYDMPKKTARDSYAEKRENDNEFLEEDIEEYVLPPKKEPHLKYGHRDPSNGGSL